MLSLCCHEVPSNDLLKSRRVRMWQMVWLEAAGRKRSSECVQKKGSQNGKINSNERKT